MFISIISFPPIKPGREEEFMEWVAWSNREFSRLRGFRGRRLLKPLDGGNYVAILEHDSYETFKAMQSDPIHGEAHKRVVPLLEGNPEPRFFNVIMD